MSSLLLPLTAVVVLLLLAVLLVAAEAALAFTSVPRVASLADGSDRMNQRIARVTKLLENAQEILDPLRLAIVTLRLGEASVVALLATDRLALPWALVAMAVNLVVVFVVTEALPRILGTLHADRASLALAPFITAFIGALPIRITAGALVRLANVIAPGKGLPRGPYPQELIAMADAAVEDSVIDEGERDLIESVIEFGGTVVREVMVPRTDMTTIGADSTVADALQISSAEGYSRVPVVGDGIDDVTGLLYVKDLIRAELDGRAADKVELLLRPAHFVPETKKVSELLKEMQQQSFHMAVAIDEYGGVAGLVTLEDLIEELVGEIVDEYDVEEPLVQRQRDGSLQVDARILIDELNDLAGLDLPEGDWDTVGGLVFDLFGRIPHEADTCEVDGYTLRVERVQGRRITKVRILAKETERRTESAV